MLYKFFKFYQYFIDERLKHNTIVILFIALLIVLAGILPKNNFNKVKANTFEITNYTIIKKNKYKTTIFIDGKEYELYLIEIKNRVKESPKTN